MAAKKKLKAVVVTTEFRGVFFGYVKDDKNFPETMTLTGVRNCIYWESSVGGVFGLAATGPSSGSRIGQRVDEMTICKITSLTPCDDTAVKAWESASVYGK